MRLGAILNKFLNSQRLNNMKKTYFFVQKVRFFLRFLGLGLIPTIFAKVFLCARASFVNADRSCPVNCRTSFIASHVQLLRHTSIITSRVR